MIDQCTAQQRSNNICGRHQRLIKAHDDALAIERNASRQFRRERRSNKCCAKDDQRQENGEKANFIHNSDSGKSRAHAREGRYDGDPVRRESISSGNQQALDDNVDEAGVGEHSAQFSDPERMSMPAESGRQEQRNLRQKHRADEEEQDQKTEQGPRVGHHP